MKRSMPLGWMFWIWAALASGAATIPQPTPTPTPTPIPATSSTSSTLELAWCTVEASSCCLTTGSLRLHGVAGQPDVGTLTAAPVVLAGGFLLPGDPVIKLLTPTQPVTWGIGEWVTLQYWVDVPVTGDRIRLELWRNQKKVVEFSPLAQSTTYRLIVPIVPLGSGYSLRAVSVHLEAIGNPNPWVETGPIITLVKRNEVEPSDWALYE